MRLDGQLFAAPPKGFSIQRKFAGTTDTDSTGSLPLCPFRFFFDGFN
jgi:hypothetical protein